MPKGKNKVWVMVETISTMRHRYMIETPEDHTEWAMDSVVMEEANEFSQKFIGEQIIGYQVISQKDLLSLCDKDNNYASGWSDKIKIETFCTR